MASSVRFAYVARRGDGTRVRGTLHAGSAEAAVALVRERALVPVRVWPRRPGRRALPLPALVHRVSGRELVGFMHAFATMLRSGVPVLRILDVLEDESRSAALKSAVSLMQAELLHGASLSHAVEAASVLGRVHTAMVRAGEAGGILDETLQRVADGISREHAVRRRVYAALTYPAVVALAALVAIVLLLGTLTPALARLFAEMSVPMPPSTRIVLAAGELLRSPLALTIAASGLGAALAAAAGLLRSPRSAAILERALLGVPVCGALRRALVVARVARTLAALLRSGLPALEAVDLAAESSASAAATASLRELRRSLREGEDLATRLASAGFFPPLFIQMVRVGEECGTLDGLLDAVADFYDVEAETALHTLTTLIEPLLIAVLGVVVATIALAVFLPLYGLIGSLR